MDENGAVCRFVQKNISLFPFLSIVSRNVPYISNITSYTHTGWKRHCVALSSCQSSFRPQLSCRWKKKSKTKDTAERDGGTRRKTKPVTRVGWSCCRIVISVQCTQKRMDGGGFTLSAGRLIAHIRRQSPTWIAQSQLENRRRNRKCCAWCRRESYLSLSHGVLFTSETGHRQSRFLYTWNIN